MEPEVEKLGSAVRIDVDYNKRHPQVFALEMEQDPMALALPCPQPAFCLQPKNEFNQSSEKMKKEGDRVKGDQIE